MTHRFRSMLAATGLWLAPLLPGVVAGEPAPPNEPARLAIDSARPIASNQQLAGAIAERLKQSGQLRHYCIDVAVQSGVAELIGQVSDLGQREEALRLARGVEGVQQVVDRLVVRPEPTIVRTQAEAVPPPVPLPREPAQLLPKAPTPSGGPAAGADPNAIIEPMPMMMGAGAPSPYDLMTPRMPPYAWPTYAPYNNYSRVAIPTAYPYNAWPFIGPPYPFPKIPLGWRSVKLEWQDGHWWFSKLGTSKDWWRLRYW